jgi:coenzyme F420-0:L-glutamate ligase/coenzyme F420-1:gamma-L-glutamate ligase
MSEASTGPTLAIFAVTGLPLVDAGADLAGLIEAAIRQGPNPLVENDIIVVAQKIVSKAERRLVRLDSVKPGRRARALARTTGKDPRLVELILGESRKVRRSRPNLLIVEHRLGFVMANAGIDLSNVGPDGDCALLLPRDPDASAVTLRERWVARFGIDLGVVINDSFGRPFRRGTVGVALGAAGIPTLLDQRGKPDLFGRPLQTTQIGLADEVAAAASLVMGQAGEARPVVVVRGLNVTALSARAADLIRPDAEDLFR